MMKPGGTGWNDPPKLSHQVYSETKTRRNMLNQRVAHLNHSSLPSKVNETFSPDAPPPTDLVPTTEIFQPKTESTITPQNIFVPSTIESMDTPVSVMKTSAEIKSDDEIPEPMETEKIDTDSMINFVSVLLSITSNSIADKNSSVAKDIAKKLEILKSMLSEERLSADTTARMQQLTLYLQNKQYQKAWDIHVALMCDRVSEVGLWMVGVKRLITELRKVNSSS